MARSEEYLEMFDLVAKHGQGFKPPSYHEVRVKYLKEEIKLTHAKLEEHKAEWKESGLYHNDGWLDRHKEKDNNNFFSEQPQGNSILEVH